MYHLLRMLLIGATADSLEKVVESGFLRWCQIWPNTLSYREVIVVSGHFCETVLERIDVHPSTGGLEQVEHNLLTIGRAVCSAAAVTRDAAPQRWVFVTV